MSDIINIDRTTGKITLDELSALQVVMTNVDKTLITADYLNQDVKTTASPTFAGLTVDSPTLFVDSVAHEIGINTITPVTKFHIAWDGVTPPAAFYAASDIVISTESIAPVVRFGVAKEDGSTAGAIGFIKARGSFASPAIVQDGDLLGNILFSGYDGTTRKNSVLLSARVDGTPGASDMPGRFMILISPDGSSTEAEVFRISNNGYTSIGTGATANERLEVAGKIRANTAFNLNGTDGVTQAASAGTVADPTAIAGGIVTAQTQITYIADGAHSLVGITSITTANGRITAMS